MNYLYLLSDILFRYSDVKGCHILSCKRKHPPTIFDFGTIEIGSSRATSFPVLPRIIRSPVATLFSNLEKFVWPHKH